MQVDEGSAFLTDPKEAVEFVLETGCDSLAAAIGTSHGPYKFKGKQSLYFEVIREIQKLLPGTPIVMHGSSSVPEEEVRPINEAGGRLDPSACGVDVEEYLPAARLGVTKINIDCGPQKTRMTDHLCWESDENSRRTRREPIVMVQPVQYRLGHDRWARAQGMPMRSQRRRHTPWRIGHAWP